MVLHNHSMIEEERLDEEERIKKKFRVRYLDQTYAPVGHVYSVMVEELGIENPSSIKDFIEELNKYNRIRGSGYAFIESPLDYFYFLTTNRLEWYLRAMLDKGEINKRQLERIMKAAYPPYELWF